MVKPLSVAIALLSAFAVVAAGSAVGVVGASAWLSRNHDAAGGITSYQGQLIIERLDAIEAEQRKATAKIDDVHAAAGAVARQTLYIQEGLCATQGVYFCRRQSLTTPP